MPRPLKQLRQRPLLYQEVQDAIKSHIIDNHLRPGDSLPPETELASQLGVSRNSVREAVKGLESLGILETRHGSGVFVGEFSIEPLFDSLPYGLLIDLKDLRNLLDVRRVLESGMIESALRAMSDQQIADLEQLVDEMRVLAERDQTFSEQDRAFRQKLYEGLDNSTLLRVIDVFWLASHKTSAYTSIEDRDPLHTYRDHVAILDAVKAGDAERVRSALEQHHWSIITRLERAQQGGES
jgi:DNA-binding FadR family transcriptional regulator